MHSQGRFQQATLGGSSVRILSHRLCGVVDLERHYVDHPAAALHRILNSLTHEITLQGCDLLRSPAGPELVHAVHRILHLVPNETLQNAMRFGLDMTTAVMGRSTDQFSRSFDMSGGVQQATERSARNAAATLQSTSAAAQVTCRGAPRDGGVIANGLNALPAADDMAELLPSELTELFHVAVTAAEQVNEHVIRQFVDRPLFGLGDTPRLAGHYRQ
jgi:hypothetical protein